MLSAPRQHEILASPIQNKVFACLTMCFNVKKNIVQSIIKLDQPTIQYGRVTHLEGGDLMIGWELVPQTDVSHDVSFVQVESCLFHMHTSWALFYPVYSTCACQKRRTPEFELQNFFGQLQHILVLELPSTLQLNLAMPTMIILALIKNVKATLTDNIYYYKGPCVGEVVNLTMVQCIVGRIWDRDEWGIIDRSNNVAIQVDWNYLCAFFFFCLF